MPPQLNTEPGQPFFASMNDAREFMSGEEQLLSTLREGIRDQGTFQPFAADLGLETNASEEDARAAFVERHRRFQEDLLPEWNGKWLPTIQAIGVMDQPAYVEGPGGRPVANPAGNPQAVNTLPDMPVAAGLAALQGVQQRFQAPGGQAPGGQTPVPLVPNADFDARTLRGNDAHLLAGDIFINSRAFRPNGQSPFKNGDGTSPYVPIPVNINDFLSVGGGGYQSNWAIGNEIIANQRRELLENNLMLTTDGVPPESTRTGRWVADEQIQPRFMDIIPQFGTMQEFVIWMKENDISYQAREVAEAGDYPEENLGGVEQQMRVRDIATIINVTAQQLADVSFVRSYIMASLGASMRQRLSRQLLRGSAQNVTLKGMWAYTGDKSESTPANRDGIGETTYADANDDKLVLLLDQLVKVMENSGERAEPNRIVMTPRAWFKTITDTDSDKNFRVWGPNTMGPRMLWSTSVVLSMEFQKITDMLVGDFSIANCGFALREGLSMQTSDSHKDNFGKRILTIRAQMRGALCVFRPSAFIKVAGADGDHELLTANAYTL